MYIYVDFTRTRPLFLSLLLPLHPLFSFCLLSLVFVNTTQFLQVDYCMCTCRVTCSPRTRIHVDDHHVDADDDNHEEKSD